MASTYQQMMAKALQGEATPAEPIPRNQDFALHKRNLKRMVDGGSTEDDINGYLSHEGITPEQLRAAPKMSEGAGRFSSPQIGASADRVYKEADDQGLASAGEVMQVREGKAALDFTPFAGLPNLAHATRAAERGAQMGYQADIAAAAKATGDTLTGRNADKSWNQNRQSHRRVENAINEYNDEQTGWGGTAAKFAGGMATAAPKAIAGVMGEAAAPAAAGAWNGLKEFAPAFLKQTPKLAGIGAVVGGVSAFGESHDDSLGGRLEQVPQGMLDGAMMGPLFGAALGGTGAAMTGRRQLKANRAQARNATATEMEAQGVTPFGPAITDNRLTQVTGEKLADSVLGGKLRDAAQTSIDDTTSAAQKLFRRGTEGRSASELGEDLQSTLKHNLTVDPYSSDDYAAMPATRLQRLARDSVPREVGAEPPPLPGEQPGTPRQRMHAPDYGRFRPEHETVNVEPVKPAYPKLEEIPPRPHLVEERQAHLGEMERIAHAHENELRPQHEQAVKDVHDFRREVIERLKNDDSLVYGPASGPYSANLVGSNRGVYGRIKDHTSWSNHYPSDTWNPIAVHGLPPRDGARLAALHQKANDLAETMHQRHARHEELSNRVTQVEGEMARVRQQDHQAALDRARSHAEQQTRHATAEAQQKQARAKAETEFHAHNEVVAREEAGRRRGHNGGPRIEVGADDGVHTYPTQFAAKYELDRRATPKFQANPLSNGANTATGGLLAKFAEGARLRYGFRGYKGDVYKPDVETELFRQSRGKTNREGEAHSAIEEWASGAPSEPRPQSVIGFIRANGGIRDEAGDLRAILGRGGKGGKGYIAGLINKNGQSADAMRHRLIEAGYLHDNQKGLLRTSTNDVHDLVQRAASGERIVPHQFAAEEAAHVEAKASRQVHAEVVGELHQLYTENNWKYDLTAREERQVTRLVSEGAHADNAVIEVVSARPAPRAAVDPHIETAPSNQFNSVFDRHLRKSLGSDVADMLRTYVSLRNAAQHGENFDFAKMDQLRQKVGDRIGDLKRAQRMGESRAEDHAMLAQLYHALKTDAAAMLRAQGEGGQRAQQLRDIRSDEYKSHIETMRKPLAQLYGDKVTGIAAMDKLAKAVEHGDARTVRSFMRVMAEKDNPTKGASAIVMHMTENAKDLPTFNKAMKTISAEMRNELFRGEAGKRYRSDLEALERIGTKLAPYQKAVTTGGKGLHFTNSILGLEVAMHAMHYMAHPQTLIAAAGSGLVLSRFLASPRYVNWLRNVPKAVANGGVDGAAFRQHMARVGAMATRDKGIGNAVLEAVKEAISPSKAQATFGGEGSATANREALTKAQKMEADGSDREAIWKTTGWFKQPDGKWRYEISDEKSDTTPAFDHALTETKGGKWQMEGPMSDFYDHDKLYEAYPHLKDMKTSVQKFPKGMSQAYGTHNSETQTIRLNSDPKRTANARVVGHELQHEVQNREKFQYSAGGRANAYKASDHDYERFPGEAEAFNVTNRHTMTDEERWQRPPWTTGDVPDNEVAWGKGGARTAQVAEARKKAVDAEVVGPAHPDQPPAKFFTSLERPPTAEEVSNHIKAGAKNFDFDLDGEGGEAAAAAIRKAGGKVTAYHVGGGGGKDWGSKATGEQVRKYDTPEQLAELTADTKRLVSKGADYIHFDNTHRMSGKRLEQIAEAIQAGGAQIVAKNNADKWNLVMRRRPDIKPAYAVIEAAMKDANETEAAHDLAKSGVPVHIIGFRKSKHPEFQISDDEAKAYAKANPWAKVLLMDTESQYEGRNAVRFNH